MGHLVNSDPAKLFLYSERSEESLPFPCSILWQQDLAFNVYQRKNFLAPRSNFMMVKCLKFCLFFIVVLAPLPLAADSVATPFSYITPSPNGKYVFVMISPIRVNQEGGLFNKEQQEKEQRIRGKYKVSGLYLNDGSTIPLWTVDWYTHVVLVPSDGIHLVRSGPWAHSLSDEAFTFFEYGRPIRSVKIDDLVDTTWFLHKTVSHFFWSREMKLDDANKTLTVVTLSKERHVFDYRTGAILHSSRPIRAIFLFTALIVMAAAFVFVRKMKRKSQVIAPS